MSWSQIAKIIPYTPKTSFSCLAHRVRIRKLQNCWDLVVEVTLHNAGEIQDVRTTIIVFQRPLYVWRRISGDDLMDNRCCYPWNQGKVTHPFAWKTNINI